jgi:hypothetical protein
VATFFRGAGAAQAILNLLYRQSAEQAFIDGDLMQAEAVAALGAQRVAEIEYAKQALAQDIARGLGVCSKFKKQQKALQVSETRRAFHATAETKTTVRSREGPIAQSRGSRGG